MAPFDMHPLDSLSAEEMKQASGLILAAFEKRYPHARSPIFNAVTLEEPLKSELLAFDAGKGPIPARKCFAILQPPRSLYQGEDVYAIVEVILNLDTGEVEEWQQVPAVQPLITPEDCFEAEEICKADAKVCEMLASRYGIHDVQSDVACDPWSVHEHGKLSGRLVQLFLYKRLSPNDNQYAHPIDMVPVLDLDRACVVHIDVTEIPQRVNEVPNNYHHALVEGGLRADPPKPLNVVQPEGPSFTVVGNKVSWQKWSFRVGFNFREGLVLHQVGYQDLGRLRPVLFRASMVEMAVPYAEPRAPYHRKCAFDVSDYGLGNCTTSLSLGCDCLGAIKYFDAVLNDRKGHPVVVHKAVCMHEEDVGLLWKHVDYRTGHSESRRARRLVISFLTTVVNYEYLNYWYLYQDGSMEFDIKLTGQLSTNALSPGEEIPAYGTLVDPGVNAQHHQHMFCVRLDMAVDDPEGGKHLEVVEQEVVAAPPHPTLNPCGNGFVVRETVLENEEMGQRVASAATARAWIVRNPRVQNRLGQPVGYKIVVPENPLLLASPTSLVARKGAFASKNMWVTPYARQERWPAGEYPTQSEGGQGLPQWVRQKRSVRDADVVVWPAYGLTHVVRTEDFGTMPVETISLKLKPVSFFDRNPAQDLPPEKNGASIETGGAGEGGRGCCGDQPPSPPN